MPVISGDDFQPPWKYRNAHYSTFIPYLFGRTPKVMYSRTRISTPDDDFLDLDFIKKGSPKLAVLCHGLEGDSRSAYIQLFADHLSRNGWDILAWNYRGCSGEMNKSLEMYNSGRTDDLHTVVSHIKGDYEEISLIGVSLGGNVVLKYAGDKIFPIHEKIRSVVAISTPIALDNASKELLRWDNFLYQWNFLLSLSIKIFKKKRQYPKEIKLRKLLKCTNLYKFDDQYTAPLFGYTSAKDYYDSNASIRWLHQIETPTLLINSLDDPFLGDECYPVELISKLEKVHFITPKYGGHVGFAHSRNDRSWMIDKVDDFINMPPK